MSLSRQAGTAAPDSARAGRTLLGGLLLVMFWMHFSSGPNDFILDDWTNLKDYGEKPWSDLARKALGHPSRPLSLFLVMASFRLFGDAPVAFYALAVACHGLILWLVLRLARALGLTLLQGAFAALAFTCLPMLSEMIRWPTMIAGAAACALPAYVAAMAGFVGYARAGGRHRLAWAGAAYAVGIFSYESGIFLPAACLALVPRSGWRRVLETGATCAGLLAVYASWRLTNAFGLGDFQLADQFKSDPRLSTVFWNARESARLVLESVLLPAARWRPETGGALLAGFCLLWGGLTWVRRKSTAATTTPPAAPLDWEPVRFGLLWGAAGLVPALVGYTAGRILFLPAIGAALALAPFLARSLRRPLSLSLLGTSLLALFFINGDAQRDWIRSGRIQREMRQTLVKENAAWQSAGVKAVVVRTQAKDQPAPPGWPYWLGQAGFLRGFALENLAFGVENPLPVYLDVECDLRLEDDTYRWHERFRPEQHRVAATNQVRVIWQLPPGTSLAPKSKE